MLRRVLFALLLSASLAACDKSATPDTAATVTPPPAPATTAQPAPPVVAEPAPATPAETAPAVEPAPAPPTPVASTEPKAPAALVLPAGEPPRPGVDYEIMETPQPTWARGKIEVAEVFGYTCIHCAHLQPELDAWMKTKPADIRWEYVPAVFGEPWDTFARAYFAAETLGVREKTHSAVFDAIHVQHAIKTGTHEEVADLYGTLGADRDKFLAAMDSFGVTAKFNKARQFSQRAGITGTPTFIVNGKYRVKATPDRGFAGMLKTTEFLAAYERAGQPAPGAP